MTGRRTLSYRKRYLMSAVVVLATLHPAPGREEELLAVINKLVPRVHEESGCTLYALHRDATTGSTDLVFVERYQSHEAYQAHIDGPALVELGPQLGDLLVSPVDVIVLNPVPLGNVGKGAV